jgi:glycosyltransferase involved in cell wall biosynthesis
MPEVLGVEGFYFDPMDKQSLESALVKMMNFQKLRSENIHSNLEKVGKYSWSVCANLTMAFVAGCNLGPSDRLNELN